MRMLGVYLLALLLCSCASSQPSQAVTKPQNQNLAAAENPSDETLQRIAAESLGEREGAILVIDPQTGRLRAVVNPRLAFEQTFPPGSAIKPFTALAALRAGLLDLETRRQCQTKYARGDFEIICSHPRSNAPFNLTQALAYSCNDYFAHVGERLSEGTFNATLGGFGFGERTGVRANEAAGTLSRGEWRVQTALGDDDKLQVTPIQLLAAYIALVNGGHLYRPQQTKDAAFVPSENARLNIAPAHRKALLEGMRGAVKYGTAGNTGLGKLPFFVFGKTGTSTASNGFRTQGWFVGFAAESRPVGVPAPEQVKLGVLVFLKRAHGSQAAEIAKPIFDCGLRIADCGLLRQRDGETGRRGDGETQGQEIKMTFAVNNPQSAFSLGHNPQSVRVRSISENTTRELPLEEYIAGVLAGESSIEKEFEALKAQAVVSRTFALKNLGRHAREGYDFCSTTHCQRFVVPKENLNAAARRAVAATRGEFLRDKSGEAADVYFHAACGGVTANIESLWGVEAPAYLRGVRDDFCTTMPHRRWEQTISAEQLAKALQSDERTNVGAPVKSLMVSKRDATGRAEWLTIEGARQLKVRGWDFKLIIGRSLGWQMIKSSRFEVARVGDGFVFRGGGFGHGLGLCQEGARGAARRGMNYRQIVSFYFPGLGTHRFQRASLGGSPRLTQVNYWPRPHAGSDAYPRTLSSEHFRASFGAGNDRREVENALRILESARTDLLRRLEKASLQLNESSPFEIAIHATTADFIAATGLSGWAAGATRGRRIELQPLKLLRKRGAIAMTLRHELTHSVIELLGAQRAPRWLAEGLCLHVSGEGRAMTRIKITKPLSLNELEQRLSGPVSAADAKELYALAYRQVQALIAAKGESSVWQLVAKSKGILKA